ncbi:hypothetical protein GXW82_14585 [Streptacidiphilus sp. 4-A2]|nr:hypothetical protein [Streptacidiphilus sp. 4-A2]
MFAISGYFFADELPPRRRRAGFALTATFLAAAQTDGYPNGWNTHTLVFLLMAGLNMTLVLLMAGLTNRVMAQNAERGRMVEQLGEANRRLQASMTENAGLHAQLLVQAKEAGIVEERQRLAGEIHDTLAQGLTGIVAQLEAARQARHDEAEWSRHLDLAVSLARSNLTEARARCGPCVRSSWSRRRCRRPSTRWPGAGPSTPRSPPRSRPPGCTARRGRTWRRRCSGWPRRRCRTSPSTPGRRRSI